MAHFEPKQTVNLDFLISLLDPERLRREIDAPIDATTQAFLARPHRARSTPEFNRAITRFVRAIHARAVGFRRILSTAEAFAIAVSLLDRSYDPAGRRGYLVALLAVVKEAREPIATVLLTLAEGIKETERDKYRRYVYGRFVDGLTWTEKCDLAAEVLRHPVAVAHSVLFGAEPALLASELPELIDAYIASLATARGLSARILARA